MVEGVRWGHLSVLSESHSICGESVHIKENYTFAAGHRVRLYTFKKNVVKGGVKPGHCGGAKAGQ
jgi:hypothetical protein